METYNSSMLSTSLPNYSSFCLNKKNIGGTLKLLNFI